MGTRVSTIRSAVAVAGAGAALLASAPTVQAQAALPWSDVAVLSGCWAGTMGSLDMREQWTEAEGDVMLGTTRYFRDGVLVDFEFASISVVEDAITLWPYPGGNRSPRGFPLVRSGSGELVFENLEHDFPVRIIYARDGGGGLAPRIEGRDGSSRGWTLSRVDCPG